jgi:hypothetical protein
MGEDSPLPWNWGRVASIAEESRCLPHLYVGLRLATLALGAPLPEEFLEHLSRRLPPRAFPELRIRLLARQLTGPPLGHRGRWIAGARWICKHLAPA